MLLEKLNTDAFLRTIPRLTGTVVTSRAGIIVLPDTAFPPYLLPGDAVIINNGEVFRVTGLPEVNTDQYLVRILRSLRLDRASAVKRGPRT